MALAVEGRKITVKAKALAAAAARVSTSSSSAGGTASKHLSSLPSDAPGKNLPVPAVQQQTLNWCWAGCGAMLLDFFHEKRVRQCQMANQLFGQTDCCSSPTSQGCDQACDVNRLAKIYSRVGIQAKFVNGQVGFSQVQSEIEAGRPVAVGFEWEEGGGHIVLIRGFFEVGGTKYLEINDPQDGSVSFRTLTDVKDACDRGKWKWTWIELKE